MEGIFQVPNECFFTGTCSRLSIVYCLYGLLAVLLGKKGFYFAIVIILLILLGFAFDMGLPLVDAIIYLGLGAVLGIENYLLLGTPVLLDASKAQHRHSMGLFFGQLVLLLLAFPFVDAFVPETGFIYGVWLALLGFLIWWGFVMFINLKKVPTHDDYPLIRTYCFVLLDGVLLFLPALISRIGPVIFTSLGMIAAFVGNIILKKL
jgi:hypothetical protein